MSTKKKTILRVKRKFSDIQAVDTIVLSQTQSKKQRIVPWNELCKSFDKNFSIEKKININKDSTETKVDLNVDFTNLFDKKPKHKKQVFRLMTNDKDITRHFQPNNFNEKYSQNRKSKILQKRRSNRQNYFEKKKKEINDNKNKKNEPKTDKNILQHDDFDTNSNTTNTKAKPNKNINIKMIQNKLLQKQKLNRTTKIVSKKQIREHQNKMKSKCTNNSNNNGSESVFCDDWNNNNLISLNYNGERINMKNFIGKYDCFKGYKPTNNEEEKGINVIDVEFDENKQKYIKVNNNKMENKNEYDYYELDEEANADDVIMAIQMRIKEKQKQQIQTETEMQQDNLENKLENIKKKYLPTKNENNNNNNNNFIQHYHERLISIDINAESSNEGEIEREDECHRDNEYPDEHEFSDYDNYNINDDYFPTYNDQYQTVENEPIDTYNKNALDIDFFTNYDFN